MSLGILIRLCLLTFQVFNYSLVLEGTPQTCSQMFEDNLFSCSSLFKNIAIERQAELAVYLHFSWRHVCRRRFAILQGLNSIDIPAQLDPGTFHLLFVAHKFPLLQQVCHCIFSLSPLIEWIPNMVLDINYSFWFSCFEYWILRWTVFSTLTFFLSCVCVVWTLGWFLFNFQHNLLVILCMIFSI